MIHSSTLLWEFGQVGLKVAHLCCNEKIEEMLNDVLRQIVNQLKVFLFAATFYWMSMQMLPANRNYPC